MTRPFAIARALCIQLEFVLFFGGPGLDNRGFVSCEFAKHLASPDKLFFRGIMLHCCHFHCEAQIRFESDIFMHERFVVNLRMAVETLLL